MDYDTGIRLDAINAKVDAVNTKLDLLIKALSKEPEKPKRRDEEDEKPKLSKKAPEGGEWREA